VKADLTARIKILDGEIEHATHFAPTSPQAFAVRDVARPTDMPPIMQFECKMKDAPSFVAHKIHAVMIGVAAHEDKEVLEPVRPAEAERLLVIRGGLLRVADI